MWDDASYTFLKTGQPVLRQPTWNIPIIIIGILLGRATILGEIAPFAVPFVALFFYLSGRRKRLLTICCAILLGAVSLSYHHVERTVLFLLILVLVKRLFFRKDQINHLPYLVFVTNLVGQVTYLWLFSNWTATNLLCAAIEVVLSVILSFIFVNSIPLFTVRRKSVSLQSEEILCLIILLGSVITGMLGIEIGGIAPVNVLARFLVLAMALVGGSLLATFVGVITGVMLSLADVTAVSQIGLLAFAGLLAGLFQNSKKLGVIVSFLIGATIISFYNGSTEHIIISSQESLLAALFFLFTPKRLFAFFARYIPGTREHQNSYQEYIYRLRDITATRVERFQALFEELAFNFRENKSKECLQNELQVQQFIDRGRQKTCKGCSRYMACWERNTLETYKGMTDLMTTVEAMGDRTYVKVPKAWDDYCLRSEKMLTVLREEYQRSQETEVWLKRMKNAERIVAEQLTGVSEVMSGLVGEIKKESQIFSAHEEQIEAALNELGLAIQRIDIINLEQGKVEIEVTIPTSDSLDAGKKIVAPLLSEILGEPIAVVRKVMDSRANDATILFGSAKHYEVKASVAKLPKEGGYISGDSYSFMNLGTGKYVVALSDGMGNGGRAYEESVSALKLLNKLLRAGMDYERSLQTVNAILRLRSTDEMFATIDLAIIDLHTAQARFMKIGSNPGFIKRNDEVITIGVSTPPIGILPTIDVDPIELQLVEGDLIIMMTDGLHDAAIDGQESIIELINGVNSRDPQDFADQLLAKVLEERQGYASDDMTLVVAKVNKYSEEWSTIRLAKTYWQRAGV